MAKTRKHLTDAQVQSISHALADPRRFAILQQIAANATTPCSDLKEQQVISPATISHHLKELAEAELIEIERQGRCANLTLRRDNWAAYLAQLSKL